MKIVAGRRVYKTVLAAMCVALGVALPITMHGIPNAGSVLLPMHIPVLLCGLLCGGGYGLACGVLTPILSAAVTGMPGPAYLPSMVCELAVYGLAAGVLISLVRTHSRVLNIYTSLVGAMLIGRIAYGAVNALIFSFGDYSVGVWLTASFVTALPGIAVQLIVLPTIVLALDKFKLN